MTNKHAGPNSQSSFLSAHRTYLQVVRVLCWSVEQVGITYVTVQEVCGIIRVQIISFVEVIIARHINNLHVSCHERYAAVKANKEVKLHAGSVVVQQVMNPLWVIQQIPQHYRCRLATKLLHSGIESRHVVVR